MAIPGFFYRYPFAQPQIEKPFCDPIKLALTCNMSRAELSNSRKRGGSRWRCHLWKHSYILRIFFLLPRDNTQESREFPAKGAKTAEETHKKSENRVKTAEKNDKKTKKKRAPFGADFDARQQLEMSLFPRRTSFFSLPSQVIPTGENGALALARKGNPSSGLFVIRPVFPVLAVAQVRCPGLASARSWVPLTRPVPSHMC